MGAIRLLIADHHCIFGEALGRLLESAGYQMVGYAKDREDCLRKLDDLRKKNKIDLLILDFMMPGEYGIEVLKEIQGNGIRVLVLTGQMKLGCFEKAVDLGVDGYLLKSCCFTELREAIEVVIGGERYLQGALLARMKKKESDLEMMRGLTRRELEVLSHLSLGMYNKEIALKLEISERTVKNHVANIFKKIGVADRTQAAVFAIRCGLVELEE